MNEELLKANNDTRVRARDAFMLIALWMELYPVRPSKTAVAVRPVGCVLVDPRDRILSLQYSGEAHAIVRAILKSPVDPHGCDIYVSRFPCSLCTKMMVQAGIRKIYYFPAKGLEMDWKCYCEKRERDSSPSRSAGAPADKVRELQETNINSVMRLVANNPIAMSKYIPSWQHPSHHTRDS
ncbi:Cytidine and dCMP deaminase domain-containing protein 1, partial [Kappamyces sp. JEL0680]